MTTFDAHANFAYGVVLVAPNPASSGTTLTLQAGQGAVLPTPPFDAIVWPAIAQPLSSNCEIVRVTNVNGDVVTMTRGPQAGDPGGTNRSIVVGDQFADAITAKSFTDLETAVNARLLATANLSDLSSPATARSNLALGTGAVANIDTTAGDFQQNGTAAAGSTGKVADAGHVHPTDTSRAPLASPGFTGVVTLPAIQNTTAAASATYTVGSGDFFKTLDATSGAFNVNLPAATGTGRTLSWRAINTNANVVTIKPAGSDTIDGVPSTTVGAAGSGAVWQALQLIDAATGAWRSL